MVKTPSLSVSGFQPTPDSNHVSATFHVQIHTDDGHIQINGFQLARVLGRYPFITARVWLGIYWQALRLWFKKCPIFPHPEVLHPHEATRP